MNDKYARRFLSREDAARLPPDLDFAAIDELLGRVPPEHRSGVLNILLEPSPPDGVSEEWAMSRILRSEDGLVQAIIDRIYAPRNARYKERG